MTTSRYGKGGFEDRFRVTRVDGKPIRPEARYLVLDYSGADPHALVAIEAYAASVDEENHHLAMDLLTALQHPEAFPAQHD